MAFIKRALHLLHLIENRRYDEAVTFIKASTQGESGALKNFVPDLVYKVAYSFGNENNTSLKLLLVHLFDLLTSATQRYHLSYELLTWRTSPFLTEVLLSQLLSLVDAGFQGEYPDLCDQICTELPKRLERRLCERLTSVDEELCYATDEAAHILAFYDRIPFKISYKFDRLIGKILNELAFDDAAAYPFLIWYAREHPFSPRLLGHTEPTVLIPNVYDQRYLRLRLVEGICEYIASIEHRGDDACKLLAEALRFLLNLSEDCQEMHSSHLNLYTEMIVSILWFLDDMFEPHRFVILKVSCDIISYIPMEFRVLLLKNVVAETVTGVLFRLKYRSRVVSWLLDQYEKDLSEKIFMNELGSLLGLLENFVIEGDQDSSSFCFSLLRIIRAFARNCINALMLVEIRERLLQPIHYQIKEYLQHIFTKEKSKTTSSDAVVVLRPPSAIPLLDEQTVELFQSALQDCEKTMTCIDEVLSFSS